jgi:uncharacterized protein
MVAKGCTNEDRLQSAGVRKNLGLTIIFKATDQCNAGCRFCSAAGKESTVTPADFEILAHRIEEYILETGIERLNFTFHGGEPTLLGAEFLESACIRLRHLPISIKFSMQSNLLEFPADLITVVRRYGIHVGSSVDPIESGRCTDSGGDTFPAWVRNHELLEKCGVYGGAIFLVTRPAAEQGKRVYRILNSCASLGETEPAFQFNLVYPQGRAAENTDLLVSPAEAGRFLVDAYEAWEESGRESYISPFVDLASWFDAGRERIPRLTCGFVGRCHESHIGIDSELNLSGCGRRVDSGAIYGNIRSQSILSLLSTSEERKKLAVRSAQLAAGECSDCEFFIICSGGCPDDAALGNGNITDRTAHCESYKMLFEAMAARSGIRRVPPPARRPLSKSVVYIGVDAGGMPSFVGSDEHLECWLLPTVDGHPLKFSSRLHNLLQTGAGRVRIFASGEQVNRLHLWVKVLSDPRVEVVLFDAPEMLLDNLAVLGRLGARARLDIESLVDCGWSGGAALDLARKYLREAEWNVRIEPFEDMLMAAVRRERSAITNRHGLTPGHYRICIGSLAGASESALRLVQELCNSENVATSSYYIDHRECSECQSYTICGSQLAPVTTGSCSDKLRQLVELLQTSAEEIRSNLTEDCPPIG